MATLAEARASIGICEFCKEEIVKGKMTQHLKACKQRRKEITILDADSTKQKTKLLSLLIEGKYNPQYWMRIELPASEPLQTLDNYLRDMWVECCEHLSAFTIDGTSYDSEPEDLYFDMPQYSDAPSEDGAVIVEEEEQGDEDEGDVVDVAAWLENATLWTEQVPAKALDELRKTWDRDELVAFLKEKLKQISGTRSFIMTPEGHRDYVASMMQESLLNVLLHAVEDTSLNVPIGKVVKVGQTFKYDYDFGSTTTLSLKVMAEREGVVKDESDAVELLARNNSPVIPCIVCGKLATKVAGGYDFNIEAHAYCDKHAAKSKDEDMMLPIVNSPRVGVCGYTGESEFVEDWDEDEDEDEE